MRISDWSSDVCSSDLPLPRQHVSNRRSAPCIGFGGMRVFVGHAIDAHQMRIMTLRDRSRPATYVLALRRGVEENGDLSTDRQQGVRSFNLRLSSIKSAASWPNVRQRHPKAPRPGFG